MTKVKIEMEDGDIMLAELYEDIAPITCDNFIKLAKKGFYNGLIFHRGLLLVAHNSPSAQFFLLLVGHDGH